MLDNLAKQLAPAIAKEVLKAMTALIMGNLEVSKNAWAKALMLKNKELTRKATEAAHKR